MIRRHFAAAAAGAALLCFGGLEARPSAAVSPAPVVSTTDGQLAGATLDQGGAVFRGIPFAQPPVGPLRWREPMPAKPWTGVRDATKLGPICAQSPIFVPDAARISSEDCLYLNVWTPNWPARSAKMPVMVWVEGGGNFAGGGITPGSAADDPVALVRRGVVVVEFNYRLGSLGFFAHPALTRESPHHASGNQGLLDQIAALTWVQRNVSRFGGDPGNVTLFGESAGSIDISVLMTSPLSRGLFRRAIAESGSVILPGSYQELADAERRGAQLAVRWGAPADATLEHLRSLSPATILKEDPPYLSPDLFRVFPAIGIVIDGYVVPAFPARVFASGKEHRVDLLHGSTSWDAVPGTPVPQDLDGAIRDTYGPLAGQAAGLYPPGNHPLHGRASQQWATDTSFRCAAETQLTWHALAGNATYQYEFAHVPPAARQPELIHGEYLPAVFGEGVGDPGAAHASDVPYVFGALHRGIDVFYAKKPLPAAPVDAQVSDAMQAYWTNFAKTGDPNGPGLPQWPRFDPAKRSYLQFTSQGPVAGTGLRRSQCDLFAQNVRRRMSSPEGGL
jgi:para-nitrobenzyl esterase